MTKILSIVALLILSTACIKTADQVQREKRFENMNELMKDSQGLLADVANQMKDMQSQLDKMNGRIEELEHSQKKMSPDQMSKAAESVELVRSQQENQSTQLNQIQNELKEQRAFIEKVTASLGSMGSKSEAAPKAKKKALKKK